ncbi:G patch domain-containing protein 4 [Chanos chanos]|uniref:G patch domain-containing protein 4 n=1 Tax=Chanos chanos TaxID=29144 RepID=A0A6J2W3C1_CHACN|nr:G patch domain-containing protein 4 [Chanos chanos]
MAEVVQEKARGLKFAEQQLLRHGWIQGKGLGRDENGIAEAIKVKVKCDKGGVGHQQGEQFTFHWWDHVFNRASSSLTIESNQEGVSVKKVAGEGDEEGMISNKKPRKAKLAKTMLYGCFVKSATLLSGKEQPEQKSFSSEDSSSSSSEDEDQKLDLSTTTKLSDEDLMKACGGRTAHKGARHGLTMSAKLARLEQQEQEFMAKYGKKDHESVTSACERSAHSTDKNLEVQQDTTGKTKDKKQKKKKYNANELLQNEVPVEASENNEDGTRKLKKKKNPKEAVELDSGKIHNLAVHDNDATRTEVKKKKKKKKNMATLEEGINGHGLVVSGDPADSTDHYVKESGEQAISEISSHLLADNSVSKKKKKKKKKDPSEKVVVSEDINGENMASEGPADTTKSSESSEDCTTHQLTNGISSKKKKKKSSKHEQEVPMIPDKPAVLETNVEEPGSKKEELLISAAEEEQVKEKSKVKKRKRCRVEIEGVENDTREEPALRKKKKKKTREDST